jgi:hypothetical protein
MIRFRKTVLPLQTAYAAFFLTAVLVLITFLRPNPLSSTYVFGLIVVAVALFISVFESYKVTKAPY